MACGGDGELSIGMGKIRKRREKIGLYTDRESIGNNTKKDLFSKRFRRISCQSGFYNRCDWADDLPISE